MRKNFNFKNFIKLRKDFYNKRRSNLAFPKLKGFIKKIKNNIIQNNFLLNDDTYILCIYINFVVNFVMILEFGNS